MAEVDARFLFSERTCNRLVWELHLAREDVVKVGHSRMINLKTGMNAFGQVRFNKKSPCGIVVLTACDLSGHPSILGHCAVFEWNCETFLYLANIYHKHTSN